MSDRIICIALWDDKKTKVVNSITEASEYTRLTIGRIEHLLRSGMKWKGWVFDYE